MRTVDASLTTALTGGNYAPYARIICLVDPPTTETHDAIYFELTGTKCKVMFKKQTYVSCVSFVIERGCIIAGSEVGLTTGTFYPLTAVCENDIVTIEGSLFKNVLHLSVAGNFTYAEILEDVCTEYAKTAVFKDAADAYWDNEFLEVGKFLDLNNPDHFLSIIRQKYLIFAVDNGSENVLFYYPAKTLSSASVDWEVNPKKLLFSAIYTKRNLISKDESDTLVLAYNAGAYSVYPRHNLGYIKSTDSMPRYAYPAGDFVRLDLQYFKFIMKPDLRWQDGDSIYMSESSVLSRILVKEIWNHDHSPTWRMEITGIQYFQGTEAGNMPADMINVAPFIPLYTGEFDGILDASDTYMQHALDTIDDHTHDAAYQPLDSDLTSLAALGSAADKAAYTTGAHTWAETALTAAGRALIDDADAAAQRTTLGLEAAGAGDIWVEKAGDTMTGTLALESNVRYNPSVSVKNGYDGVEACYWISLKNRGSIASPTAVQSGDHLGAFVWYGHDGTNPIMAASLIAYVAATPGTNDMPGKFALATTPDGAAAPVEAMVVDQNQMVEMAKGLHVGSLATAPTDNDISCDGTIKTAAGKEYNLGGYTAGAPTADGYLTMTVDGVTYKVLVDKV